MARISRLPFRNEKFPSEWLGLFFPVFISGVEPLKNRLIEFSVEISFSFTLKLIRFLETRLIPLFLHITYVGLRFERESWQKTKC